jgi:hydrogenase expression/formation protein HypC
MCLAIPVRIVEWAPDQMAKVSLDGVTKLISVALVDDIAIGDYVILHAGFALAKIDPGEAERTLTMIREIAGSAT